MHRSVRRIAPDATWLAAAGYDGRVRIWDAATGRRKAVLAGHSGLVLTLPIAPDSTWLASAGYDGTVRIWDTATGREREALASHTNSLETVAITADDRWLASAGQDGTVWIWDTTTWQVQALMRTDAEIVADAWLGSSALALAGKEAGLYLFSFTGT